MISFASCGFLGASKSFKTRKQAFPERDSSTGMRILANRLALGSEHNRNRICGIEGYSVILTKQIVRLTFVKGSGGRRQRQYG